MNTEYRSKIDTWLLAAFAAALIVEVVVLFDVAWAGRGLEFISVLLLITLVDGLIAWVLLGTFYCFEDTTLVVRSGPFRWCIPVHKIASITPTQCPLSSPALSLDRLKIEYGSPHRSLMISPKEQEKFLAEVEKIKSAHQSENHITAE